MSNALAPSSLSKSDICLQTKTTLGLIAFHNYCHTLNTRVVDGDNKPQEQATNDVRDSVLKLRGSTHQKKFFMLQSVPSRKHVGRHDKEKDCQIVLWCHTRCNHLPAWSAGLRRDSKPEKSCTMLLSCLFIWMSFTQAGLRQTTQPSPARGPAQDLNSKQSLIEHSSFFPLSTFLQYKTVVLH